MPPLRISSSSRGLALAPDDLVVVPGLLGIICCIFGSFLISCIVEWKVRGFHGPLKASFLDPRSLIHDLIRSFFGAGSARRFLSCARSRLCGVGVHLCLWMPRSKRRSLLARD